MSVQWSREMEELKAALKRLPEDLTDDAVDIVHGAADAAAVEIIAKYPRRTGNLKKGVKVSRSKGKSATSATVKNTAPHAYIFEKGTQARHTKIGANRGSMPPGRVFVPTATRRRRIMYDQLKSLLVRHGALVSGNA